MEIFHGGKTHGQLVKRIPGGTSWKIPREILRGNSGEIIVKVLQKWFEKILEKSSKKCL